MIIKQTSAVSNHDVLHPSFARLFRPGGERTGLCQRVAAVFFPPSCYPAVAKLKNNNNNKQHETLQFTVCGEFCRKSNFG